MAKSKLLQQLRIQLHDRGYPIYIGKGCLSDSDLLCRHIAARQVLILSNETVAPLYLKSVMDALHSMQCDVLILPDGERYKNQQSLNSIYDELIKRHHHRDTTILALGGGVVGDIAGFAAATYQRGVRFIQLPTTLLAQVDASVGGKTAINHPLGKNMIGCFHQPHAVIMDTQTLSTLPEREFTAGMAEIIKYGLLAGGDFIHQLESILKAGLPVAKHEIIATLIAECCKIKASYVEQDERETGQRALLNLGHTFAHALEAYTSYETWRHGEAVGIGLYCAALLSCQLGHLSESDLDLVDFLLKQANLPRRIPKEIDLSHICDLMYNDKKVENNRLRFILMKAPGLCYIDDSVSQSQLQEALHKAVEGECS